MKKSEIKCELLKMVASVQKRQRISKYRAAWQIKHAMNEINNEIGNEIAKRFGY